MGDGVVFAVAGAKGGVGKTTTSINLSAVLAELGHDVVLVELDLAMANVGDFLDLDVRLEHGRDPTLHEVLADTASVVDATYEAPGGFDVVPSGVTLQGFANADIDVVADVVREVSSGYDVVVLDTGAGLGTMTILPLSLADETILVTSPRVASIRDTKKTEEIVQHVGGTVAGIVFVKSGTGRSPGVDRIAAHLSVDLLGHVPEDDDVASAQDIGQPVVLARPESDAAQAYRSLGSVVNDRLDAFEPATPIPGEHDSSLTTEDADVGDFDYADDAVDGAVDSVGDAGDSVDDSVGDAGDSVDDSIGDAVDSVDDSIDDAVGEAEKRERGSTVSAVSETDTTDENGTEAVEAVTGALQSDTKGVEAATDAIEDDTQTVDAESETDTTDEDDTQTVDAERETDTTDENDTQTGDAERETDTTDENDTRTAEAVTGATDDEIAARLASLESEDSEPTTQTSGPDERHSDDGHPHPQTTRHPAANSPSAGAESLASPDVGADGPTDKRRSTVRRLIDRAFGLIGRPRA